MRFLYITSYNVSNMFYTMASTMDTGSNHEAWFACTNPNQIDADSPQWQGIIYSKKTFDISRRFSGKSILSQILELRRVVKGLEIDIIVTTGIVGLFARILRLPYIYWVYGGDLDLCAKSGIDIFTRQRSRVPFLNSLPVSRLMKHITKRAYMMAISGGNITVFAPHQVRDMEEIGYHSRGFFPHTLDDIWYSLDLKDKPYYRHKIAEILGCDNYFFSSTRHLWTEKHLNNKYSKGNDVVIHAFKKYRDITLDKNTKLILIEKGPDVENTKELIRTLNVEDGVIWIEHQPRKNMIELYMGADISFDQFGVGCLALCAVESLACGTITISYIGSSTFYPIEPPVFNSKDPEEIARFIADTMNDLQKKLQLEKDSKVWFQTQCSKKNFRKAFEEMGRKILLKRHLKGTKTQET